MGKRGNISLSFVLELIISVIVLISLIRASNFAETRDHYYVEYYGKDIELTLEALKTFPYDLKISYRPIYRNYKLIVVGPQDKQDPEYFAFQIVSPLVISNSIFSVRKKFGNEKIEIEAIKNTLSLDKLTISKVGNKIILSEGQEVCYYSMLGKSGKVKIGLYSQDRNYNSVIDQAFRAAFTNVKDVEYEIIDSWNANQNYDFIIKISYTGNNKESYKVVYNPNNDEQSCLAIFLKAYIGGIKSKEDNVGQLTLEVEIPKQGYNLENFANKIAAYFEK